MAVLGEVVVVPFFWVNVAVLFAHPRHVELRDV